MSAVAIIGGTGAGLFPVDVDVTERSLKTRWGAPSAAVLHWEQAGHTVYFLRRHGADGTIAPHRVNYRANIQALLDLDVEWVLASNAVGGIAAEAAPGTLVLPDQLIDYSWGREHSFYDGSDGSDGSNGSLDHVDMTEPFDERLRGMLIKAAEASGVPHHVGGTYGVTQGPRLETSAEIHRLERDGCSIVGMTAMPEAGLAREAGLAYASCCPVVNRAAGRSVTPIHAEIEATLKASMVSLGQLVRAWLVAL